jgi:hypothetical protein
VIDSNYGSFYTEAVPLEGPLPKRHTGEQRAGGGGYDWLRTRGGRGDVYAIEALRRAAAARAKALYGTGSRAQNSIRVILITLGR